MPEKPSRTRYSLTFATLLLAASAGLAWAQSNGGGTNGATGGANTAIPNGRAPAVGATGGASSTLNPPTTPGSPSAAPPTPTGPGVSGTLNADGSTANRLGPSGRPCNPAAVGATQGSSGAIATVTPPAENPRTKIASDRTGPTSPSTTGANLKSNLQVSGGVGTSPRC